MHTESHLEQPAVAAHREGSVPHGSCRPPSDKAASMLDGGRAHIWDHVIARLLADYSGEAEGEVYLKVPAKRVAQDVPSRHIQVEVLERLSETTIAVLWQDATRCRYLDQVWFSCRARIKGRCALSGAVIFRNDPVYKPRVRNAFPANAGAMILATVIERMPSMVA
jgi:hypothetical protein